MGYCEVGRAYGTFGIKGELKILESTDFPAERFAPGKELLFWHAGQYQPFAVDSCRRHAGYLIVRFAGLPDIDAAAPFAHDQLFVKDADRHPLPEGSYYPDMVIGLDVYQGARRLGTAREIIFSTAQPVMRVAGGAGEILIPFIPAFILAVDRENKRILINPEEGLSV